MEHCTLLTEPESIILLDLTTIPSGTFIYIDQLEETKDLLLKEKINKIYDTGKPNIVHVILIKGIMNIKCTNADIMESIRYKLRYIRYKFRCFPILIKNPIKKKILNKT